MAPPSIGMDAEVSDFVPNGPYVVKFVRKLSDQMTDCLANSPNVRLMAVRCSPGPLMQTYEVNLLVSKQVYMCSKVDYP